MWRNKRMTDEYSDNVPKPFALTTSLRGRTYLNNVENKPGYIF